MDYIYFVKNIKMNKLKKKYNYFNKIIIKIQYIYVLKKNYLVNIL